MNLRYSQAATAEPAKDTPFYEEDKSEESEDSDDGLEMFDSSPFISASKRFCVFNSVTSIEYLKPYDNNHTCAMRDEILTRN